MLARFSWPHLTSVHHPWFMVDIPWYVRISYDDVRYDHGQPPTAPSPHLTPALSASGPLAGRFFFNSKIAFVSPIIIPHSFFDHFIKVVVSIRQERRPQVLPLHINIKFLFYVFPIRFLFSLKVLWQKENILQSIFYWLVRFCSYVLSLSSTTLMLLSFLFLFFVNVFCTATF